MRYVQFLSGLVTKVLGMEICFILFPKVNNKKGIENKTAQCVYICTFSSQLQTVYKETKLFKMKSNHEIINKVLF